MTFSSTVPEGEALLPLLDYLSRRFTYQPRGIWERHIAESRILVNGQRIAAAFVVHAGDCVSFEPPEFAEPPADCDYRIIHEDPWIIGIDKPGNLPVHRAGKSVTRNLMFLLRQGTNGRAFPRASPVHRLDRGTSGVVVVALTPEGRAPLQCAFAAGRVDKEYAAVVYGTPPEAVMTIDAPIGRDEESGIGYRYRVDERRGKPASTRIELLEKIGAGYSVVRAMPRTGRTHQIRVHLAWIGTPCVGDALYAMDPARYRAWRDDPARPPSPLEFPRQALHCGRIAFSHPFTNGQCVITAPLPGDIAAFVRRARA